VGSLVHDDILDEADTRRGRPTINAVEGVNHAVLAGDYILARAAELAAGVSQDAARLVAAALSDLCEGQVLEMRDAYDPGRTVDAHLESVHGKTAALFECACRLGAHCAGLGDEAVGALGRFGLAFGMGFQVLDDVLDLIGDQERLGKPTGNDIASGVYTLPVLAALRGPTGDELLDALGAGDARASDASAPDVDRALDLVRRSGTIAEALAAADRYGDEARRAVHHLDQTTVGEGLGRLPRTYATWALATLMDPRFHHVPLTALA
jgi:heptaprenyl diphosphate synthase